jgi:hypothetical protein
MAWSPGGLRDMQTKGLVLWHRHFSLQACVLHQIFGGSVQRQVGSFAVTGQCGNGNGITACMACEVEHNGFWIRPDCNMAKRFAFPRFSGLFFAISV